MHQTGHRHDTLLIGELDPLGNALRASPVVTARYPGTPAGAGTAVVRPRSLYCVDADYQRADRLDRAQLALPDDDRGVAEVPLGQPGAVLRHRIRDPSLPVQAGAERQPLEDQQQLRDVPGAQPPDLDAGPVAERARARIAGCRSTTTEFGYITHPPTGKGYPSPATAAAWLNQTEYLSYKNRRRDLV